MGSNNRQSNVGGQLPRSVQTNTNQAQPTQKVVQKQAVKSTVKMAAPGFVETQPLYASSNQALPGTTPGEQWISKHNPYLSTLRDPVGVAGVRVPDGLSPRTVTFQYVKRQLLLANAQGVCGAVMGYNGSSNNVAASNPSFWIPQSYGGSTACIAWTTGSGSSISQMISETMTTGHGIVDASDLQTYLSSYTSKVRVVSAAMNLQPAVGFQQADGTYIGGSLPPNMFNSGAWSAGNGSFSNLQNLPGSIWVPIYNPQSPGITCTYTPTDNSCLEFTNGAKAAVNYTDADYNATSPGCMYVFASQASPADTGANHMLQIVINYECELRNGTLAFGVRSANSDPLAMAVSANARREDPLCFIGSNLFNISPASSVHDGSVNAPGFAERSNCLARIVPKTISMGRTISFASVKSNGVGNLSNLQCVCSKASKEVQELEEEKPMFESLVDTVASLGKKVLPSLFPSLKKM